MRKLLLAAACAFVLPASSLAADMPVKAPPMAAAPAAFDWSGFYVGGDAGWQWSRIGLAALEPGAIFTYRPHHDSFVGGGHLGVQRQFGMSVFGVEGSFLAATGHADLGAVPSPSIFFPGGTGRAQAKLKDIWSAGVRAGYAMGNWMPYLTGGYAHGLFEFASQNVAVFDIENAKARAGGAYIGVGVDFALTHNWIFGVEYRHYIVRATVNSHGEDLGGPFSDRIKFDPRTDTVVARLSYKFDWGKAPVVAKY